VPIYEYECSKCHHRFEKLQRFSDPPATVCSQCGGSVAQLVSAPAIQFKGTGWYVTDYAHKSSSPPPPGNGKSAPSESSPAKTETAKTEAKAAPAAEKQ
jgi:putative FmdB family regulatory protein